MKERIFLAFCAFLMASDSVASSAECPFRFKRASKSEIDELWDLMSHRYKDSLFTKGADEETKIRDRPSKKNLFGYCKGEPCHKGLVYRTLSGSCNNVANDINIGRRAKKLERLLAPSYDDGLGRPRSVSVTGKPLPNPRKISTIVHGSLQSPKDFKHTLALMQWGQFLDHDITLTPMIRVANGSLHDCRECDADPNSCSPIPVPEDDPYFPPNNTRTGRPKCIEFVRSQSITHHWREQLNLVTSWIDSSHIYGSFKCHSDHLRAFQSGKLKWLSHPLGPFKGLLPRHATNHECTSRTKLCFEAGDDRANEQPGLAAMHTLLMREHNRLAEQLELLNPRWDEHKIFEEARKIVIAINQHITYKEFLPRILGQRLMNLYNLELAKHHFYEYDETCDPAIVNEFPTAAFRFGHSLIPEGYNLKKAALSMFVANISEDMLRLRRHINNPDIVMSPMFIDELIEGLLDSPMMSYDRGITNEVLNHLMEVDGAEFSGVDLAALNIQRGRDHGLTGYIKYEHFCMHDIQRRLRSSFSTTGPLASFDNLVEFKNFDNETVSKLQQVYDNVEDIDLFTGGIAEPSERGGLVGPTFGCIIASQFEKLRKCDRFWYESPDKSIGFNHDQLTQIKQMTLSSLICNNLDKDARLQQHAFDVANEVTNPLLSCRDQPKIDLTFWTNDFDNRSSFCDIQGWTIQPGKEIRVGACTRCTCPTIGGKFLPASCMTLGGKSCKELIAEVGPEAVLSDSSCQAMCGQFFNASLPIFA